MHVISSKILKAPKKPLQFPRDRNFQTVTTTGEERAPSQHRVPSHPLHANSTGPRASAPLVSPPPSPPTPSSLTPAHLQVGFKAVQIKTKTCCAWTERLNINLLTFLLSFSAKQVTRGLPWWGLPQDPKGADAHLKRSCFQTLNPGGLCSVARQVGDTDTELSPHSEASSVLSPLYIMSRASLYLCGVSYTLFFHGRQKCLL